LALIPVALLPNAPPVPVDLETIPEATTGFLVVFLLDFAFPMLLLLYEVKIEFG
jgi:hypothetical protein